jgi:hypothetical protein
MRVTCCNPVNTARQGSRVGTLVGYAWLLNTHKSALAARGCCSSLGKIQQENHAEGHLQFSKDAGEHRSTESFTV